jgi:trans-2-enoyl-CoA reductase
MLPRMKRANSIDDLEMRPDVQEKVAKLWNEAVTENLSKYQIWKGIERILQFVWFCSRRRGLQSRYR